MDREKARTRNRLKMALVNLLRKKAFDEIKIKELTEEGDVATATFYRHYRNKKELLEDTIHYLPKLVDTDLFASRIPISEVLNSNGIQPILPLMLFIESEMTLIRNFIQASNGLVFTVAVEVMIKIAKIITPEFSERDAEIVASSILGNIYRWILSDRPYTASQMAEEIHLFTTYGVFGMRPDFVDVQETIRKRINSS